MSKPMSEEESLAIYDEAVRTFAEELEAAGNTIEAQQAYNLATAPLWAAHRTRCPEKPTDPVIVRRPSRAAKADDPLLDQLRSLALQGGIPAGELDGLDGAGVLDLFVDGIRDLNTALADAEAIVADKDAIVASRDAEIADALARATKAEGALAALDAANAAGEPGEVTKPSGGRKVKDQPQA